jgi:hypothetical protein
LPKLFDQLLLSVVQSLLPSTLDFHASLIVIRLDRRRPLRLQNLSPKRWN